MTYPGNPTEWGCTVSMEVLGKAQRFQCTDFPRSGQIKRGFSPTLPREMAPTAPRKPSRDYVVQIAVLARRQPGSEASPLRGPRGASLGTTADRGGNLKQEMVGPEPHRS
jgi:hypothetical protein